MGPMPESALRLMPDNLRGDKEEKCGEKGGEGQERTTEERKQIRGSSM